MLWDTENYIDRYNRLYPLRQKEIDDFINILRLNTSDVLVDFGCGNGDFLSKASLLVHQSVGIDCSLKQINEARQKVSSPQTQFICSSFLEYNYNNFQFTKAFSRSALHHLTDSEKKTFLKMIGPSFAKNALFLLYDAIFSFDRILLHQKKEELVKEAKRHYGEEWKLKQEDILNTWFNEYPTDINTWRDAFREGGFTIEQYTPITSFIGRVVARKV